MSELEDALEAIAEYVEATATESMWREKADGQPSFFLNEAVEARIEKRSEAAAALAKAIDARARAMIPAAYGEMP
jgi:hypothetical protein